MGSFHSSLLSDPSKYATRTTQEQAPSPDGTKAYDYIVVGGGAAGCVLASRLSEDPQTSVLLLEAGQSHEGNFLSRIPLAWPQLLTTTVNWAYETVAQTHAKDRKLRIDRGKVLGGSTTINALIYQHCAPEDFEEWVRMGAHGWGYEDMRPYLLKSETWTQHAEHPDIVELDHGTSGPWKTRFSAAPPIHKALLQACHSAGLGEIPEFNARAGPKGSSTFTSSIDEKGQRHSVANAYLTPAVLARPNLTVAINAHVEKILLTTDDASGQPRATGVQLSQAPNGPTYHAMAKCEVILSAGVISTPQILMLSGLGPREELVKHDIRTVLELPQLGKNYYDHISSGPVVFRAKPSDTLDYLNNPLSALYAVAQWSIWGTGPMSGLAAPGAAFFNVSDPDLRDLVSSKASANADVVDHAAGAGVPDIEMPWFPIVVTSFDSKPPPGVHGFTLAPVLLKPESSGSISLRSANAYDKPLIDPNYLSTPNDIAVLVRAVRLAMRVGKRAALETREPEKGSVFWLGDADPDAVTDEEITEYMREHCLSAFHPTSTARISSTPATGVVDAHLRVHGVAGLRICDASVFPSVPTGHPVALVVAVAERAADLIRAEAGSGSGVAA